jgi:hypothetical protein
MIKSIKSTKTPEELALRKALSVVDHNYAYAGVDYDYSSNHNCEDHGCDSICRCHNISDLEIKSIDFPEIVSKFTDGIEDPILAYCMGRLPGLHKLYDEEYYEPYIAEGYYGEYLDSIKILHQESIRDDIRALWSMSDKHRVEFILLKEYGYLAETIQSVNNYVVKEVPFERLLSPVSYPVKIDQYQIERAKALIEKSGLPIGVYLPRGESFSVVDGRHRWFAAQNLGVKTVKIIVGI